MSDDSGPMLGLIGVLAAAVIAGYIALVVANIAPFPPWGTIRTPTPAPEVVHDPPPDPPPGPDSGATQTALVGQAERSQRTYYITLKTADVNNAGTNANVHITLFGPRGSTGARNLEIPNHDDREQGDTDQYSFESAGVGNLERITISEDNTKGSPDWNLEYVSVKDDRTQQSWNFPCNCWLSPGSGLSKPLVPAP